MYRRILNVLVFTAVAGVGSAQSNLSTSDLSNLAAGVLDQTHLARQSVANRDHDGAMDHVRRAIATVNQIQQSAPAAEKPLMVPVLTQIETTTTTTPVRHNGDLKAQSSIRDVQGNQTTTRLNITAAGDRLSAAQTAIEAGNWGAADEALADVQSSTANTQTAGGMPLRMVQQNLELAKARVAQGKYHDAEMPLKSAAQALGDYERAGAGAQATQVETARQEMLKFADHISHEDAMARIDAWMNMLRSLPQNGQ
ncbi:MAG TPA: YfdX family protein [Bryobacteraceae bacterium]|jgi:hypothetical protein|nr:YfdX family protein [Bryobacteraceae bacterium]